VKAIKRFRVQVGGRTLLLTAEVGLLFAFLQRGQPVLAVLAGTAALATVILLFRYVDRSNRGLATFLQAVRYGDYSLSAGIARLGSSYADLDDVLHTITSELQRAREEKEEQFRYLQTVVQHIGVGLISLRSDGSVDMLNNAAKRLLRLAQLRRIEDLPAPLRALGDEIRAMHAGEKKLVKVELAGESLQLSLATAEFKRRDQLYKLVSLQNIQTELEEKEAEAWQSLTRVLTHEIMNSLTPIASLAATAGNLLAVPEEETPEEHDSRAQDIRQALQTIDKRSQGLMRFVQAYRHVTIIPKPQFRVFSVRELIDRVEDLMHDKFSRRGIVLHVRIEPETIELTADPDLIEQVLINLLLNAMDALAGRESPQIDVTAVLSEYGRVRLSVSDNGPGIEPQALEKVFIPFFSTKKEGSGIGLSFSRQVMRLHRGTIHAQSDPGQQTRFTLRF
jgi:two-component system, NtrC family, nitrogen regulation sensor histidine kinase NtrY